MIRLLMLVIVMVPLCLAAQDKLVTPGADTLDCKITAADDYVIQFVTTDGQARKIPRASVRSVYYDGRWLKPFVLPHAIGRVDSKEYDMGMLREDSPYYPAALHLDRAGGRIIGSIGLSIAAVVVAAFFGGQDWTHYAVGALAIGGGALYISSAFELRRAAYELTRMP